MAEIDNEYQNIQNRIEEAYKKLTKKERKDMKIALK